MTRLSISVPDDMADRIDHQVDEGVNDSRSGWIQDAISIRFGLQEMAIEARGGEVQRNHD